MENDIFFEDEKEIKKLQDKLDKLKYIRLCFIEQIDKGAKCKKVPDGLEMVINTTSKPSDFSALAEYYTEVSNIYNEITESIDKVKINFEPDVKITEKDNTIEVSIKLKKLVKPSETSTNDRSNDNSEIKRIMRLMTSNRYDYDDYNRKYNEYKSFKDW